MEYPLYVVLGGGLLHHGSGVPAQHVVDRGHHLQHLGLGDQAVAVLVIQAKYPLELLLHRAPRHLGQDGQEVLRRNTISQTCFDFELCFELMGWCTVVQGLDCRRR